MFREAIANAIPTMIGRGASAIFKRVVDSQASPSSEEFEQQHTREYNDRIARVLEAHASDIASYANSQLAAPSTGAGAPAQPAPAPADEVCHGCEMNRAVIVMAGYAKGVVEACPTLTSPTPKGYGGTYPLAREAARLALDHLDQMAADPSVSEHAPRLRGVLLALDKSMQNVPSCKEAAEIATVADKARQVAHKLTFTYREAKKQPAAACSTC